MDRSRPAIDTVIEWGRGVTSESHSDPTAPPETRSFNVRGIRTLSCGEFHSAIVTIGGELLIWGQNESGQLGLPGVHPRWPPVRFQSAGTVPVARFSSVACGSRHTMAIDEDGRVVQWGSPKFDQNLPHDSAICPRPVLPPLYRPHPTFLQVACGGLHSLALTESGQVARLGRDSCPPESTPSSPSAPTLNLSLSLSLSPPSSHGLDGTTLVPGLGPPRIRQVACGEGHYVALSEGCQVYTWGMGRYGALGHGAETGGEFGGGGGSRGLEVPRRVEALANERVTAVACGGGHTLALTEDGLLFSWGRGRCGQTGHGIIEDVWSPLQVAGALSGLRVVQVAAGQRHSLASVEGGRLFAWGANQHSQLGQLALPQYRLVELVLEPTAVRLTVPLEVQEQAKGGDWGEPTVKMLGAGGDRSTAIITWGPRGGGIPLSPPQTFSTSPLPLNPPQNLLGPPVSHLSHVNSHLSLTGRTSSGFSREDSWKFPLVSRAPTWGPPTARLAPPGSSSLAGALESLLSASMGTAGGLSVVPEGSQSLSWRGVKRRHSKEEDSACTSEGTAVPQNNNEVSATLVPEISTGVLERGDSGEGGEREGEVEGEVEGEGEGEGDVGEGSGGGERDEGRSRGRGRGRGKGRGRGGSKEVKICVNCGVSETPFWRKERESGKPLCNACGLFLAKNGSYRPRVLWKQGGNYPIFPHFLPLLWFPDSLLLAIFVKQTASETVEFDPFLTPNFGFLHTFLGHSRPKGPIGVMVE